MAVNAVEPKNHSDILTGSIFLYNIFALLLFLCYNNLVSKVFFGSPQKMYQ